MVLHLHQSGTIMMVMESQITNLFGIWCWFPLRYFICFLKYLLAKVAQLVEHNVANVRVVGSNPIFRSLNPHSIIELGVFKRRRTQAVRERFAKPSCTSSNLVDASKSCRGGEIGRHKGLKIPRTYKSVPVRFRPSVQILTIMPSFIWTIFY